MGCDAFLLRLVEERKGEGERGCVPNVRQSGCGTRRSLRWAHLEISVFCDDAWLSGRISKTLASAWSICLISDRSSLELGLSVSLS